MRRLTILGLALGVCALLFGAISAQEREDRTLLNWDQMVKGKIVWGAAGAGNLQRLGRFERGAVRLTVKP